MSIIASAGKNTIPGRKGQRRSSKLSERHKLRKEHGRKSWVMRDIDGASEGELESNLSRSKRYLIVLLKICYTIICVKYTIRYHLHRDRVHLFF